MGLTPPTGSATAVLIVGTLISGTAAHGRPVLDTIAIVIVGTIVTGLGATLAWMVARSRNSRRAFEAFIWLGEWELARFGELIGGAAPITLNGMTDGVHVRLTLTRGVKITSGMDPRLNQSGPTLIVVAEHKALDSLGDLVDGAGGGHGLAL